MDVKDLRTESTLGERNNDVNKYAQGGTTIQCNQNNLYQDIGSNSSGKVDAPSARPCAVIGPDRVIPPSQNDCYLKKARVEPWPCSNNVYHQRPPEFSHKIYQNPTRNISPRQTFQENMQRILVPPMYKNDENPITQAPDRNPLLSKNVKRNIVASETKYCDVPYAVNTVNNDTKVVKSVDSSVPPFNQSSRLVAQSWPSGSGNLRHQRQYGPPELYQFPEYPSCVGPRSAPASRPNRTVAEEAGFMYPEPYCQEPNIRFKPYPNIKDRCPPPRYDYNLSTNYPYPFHPNLHSQRYELSKSITPQPYPGYPHFQYNDSRLSDHMIERYPRPVNAQNNCGIPYNNQILHPVYGPINNYPQGKLSQYPLEGSIRPVSLNKLPYDGNNKIYVDYENGRIKNYHTFDNYYVSETTKYHSVKSQGILPNYPQMNMHAVPPHPYYKKDINQKAYEHASMVFNNTVSRNMQQFSPNTIAISPTDSIISNDTTQTHGSTQEDCGYISQSSTTSVRSIDSTLNRVPNEYFMRHDYPYASLMRTQAAMPKSSLISNNNTESSNKKNLNVRQFLQMWNEGDDEGIDVNSSKDSKEKTGPPVLNNQEQLYVLGLVNVPSEELGKYDHIQKVSKLPENIKGYSNLELLNQFEEAIGSTQINSFKSPLHFETPHPVIKSSSISGGDRLARPLSPLDVEAKISQSVIHKEVGCNFEIKPCSPKMLHVEIAAPVQNIGERIIEKISNPLSQLVKSPSMNSVDENNHFKSQSPFNPNDKITSCKMAETQYLNNADAIKSNYSIQDFESSSGMCLASLPRLDNDIEFNFPEVNQQFVNANKGTTTSIPPTLNESEPGPNDKASLNDLTNQLSPTAESEKETVKLSKFRKIKPQSVEVMKTDQLPSPTIRTDSVIIKNPENLQNVNDNLTNPNKTHLDNHDSTDSRDLKPSVKESQISDSIMEVFSHHDKSNDMAIDFSLKNDAKEIVFHKDVIHSTLYQRAKEKSTEDYTEIAPDVNDIKNKIFLQKDPVCSISQSDKENFNEDCVKQVADVTDIKTIILQNDINSPAFQSDKENSIEEATELVADLSDIKTEVETKTESDSKGSSSILSEIEVSNMQVDDNHKVLNIEFQLPNLIENHDLTKVSHSSNTNETFMDMETSCNLIETYNNIREEKSNENKYTDEKYQNNEIHFNRNREENIVSIGTDQEINALDEISNKLDEEEFQNINEMKVNSDSDIDTSDKSCKCPSKSNICQTLHPLEDTSSHTLKSESTPTTENHSIDFVFHGDGQLHNSQSSTNNTNEYNITDDCNIENPHSRNTYSLQDDGKPEKELDFLNTTGELAFISEINIKRETNISKVKLCSPWLQKLILHTNESSQTQNNHLENPIKSLNHTSILTLDGEPLVDNLGSCSKCADYENNFDEERNWKCNESNSSPNAGCNTQDPFVQPDHTVLRETKGQLDIDKEEHVESFCQQLVPEDRIAAEHLHCEDHLTDLETSNLPTDVTILNNDNERYNIDSCNKVEDDGNNAVSNSEENIIDCTLDNVSFECDNYSGAVLRQRITLKRSYSDSALDKIKNGSEQEDSLIWTTKRKKVNNAIITQNICNIFQNNRRNSISSVYNEENVSYCIFIDNECIIDDEENVEEKVCHTQCSELSITNENNDNLKKHDDSIGISDEIPDRKDSDQLLIFESSEEQSPVGSWVEDVACIETVVSDEIAEDVFINDAVSPKLNEFFENAASDISANELPENDYDYRVQTYQDDEDLVQALYSANLSENKSFHNWPSRITQEPAFDRESLEKILSDTQDEVEALVNQHRYDNNFMVNDIDTNEVIRDNKENVDIGNFSPLGTFRNNDNVYKIEQEIINLKTYGSAQDETIHSCESSIDSVTYKTTEGDTNFITPSSPEVSSTTSEEKSSGILLKIKNYKGSKISQINEFRLQNDTKTCKHSDNTNENYMHSNISDVHVNRPLITKAAQKYIPPLKESIGDLKVKLVLPQHSLLKLKKMKLSKDSPKPSIKDRQTQDTVAKYLKKPKPKFEDVLKSIDEIHFKMHKEKKKIKKSIPKMVIKKAENGSHYASTPENDNFNPDLTGRRWQPWVFLEKNQFIDKMALKKKIKAVFSHRKNTYVLAEKFHKYKSVYSTKFVISQPKPSDASTGHLKYTIRLKHD